MANELAHIRVVRVHMKNGDTLYTPPESPTHIHIFAAEDASSYGLILERRVNVPAAIVRPNLYEGEHGYWSANWIEWASEFSKYHGGDREVKYYIDRFDDPIGAILALQIPSDTKRFIVRDHDGSLCQRIMAMNPWTKPMDLMLTTFTGRPSVADAIYDLARYASRVNVNHKVTTSPYARWKIEGVTVVNDIKFGIVARHDIHNLSIYNFGDSDDEDMPADSHLRPLINVSVQTPAERESRLQESLH